MNQLQISFRYSTGRESLLYIPAHTLDDGLTFIRRVKLRNGPYHTLGQTSSPLCRVSAVICNVTGGEVVYNIPLATLVEAHGYATVSLCLHKCAGKRLIA